MKRQTDETNYLVEDDRYWTAEGNPLKVKLGRKSGWHVSWIWVLVPVSVMVEGRYQKASTKDVISRRSGDRRQIDRAYSTWRSGPSDGRKGAKRVRVVLWGGECPRKGWQPEFERVERGNRSDVRQSVTDYPLVSPVWLASYHTAAWPYRCCNESWICIYSPIGTTLYISLSVRHSNPPLMLHFICVTPHSEVTRSHSQKHTFYPLENMHTHILKNTHLIWKGTPPNT